MTQDVQRSAFLAGEGDAWYRRNAAFLTAPNELRDRVTASLDAALHDHATVLEIGCGNGAQLAALAARRPLTAIGVDPSPEAIAAGRAEHRALQLHVGAADALPIEPASCDLALFGFCLYLVDRELLLRCAAEADRALKPRAWLAIVDFDPPVPHRRAYHHRPGLWSWKADYSQLFLGHPAYRLAQKWSASHASPRWHDDPNERVGFWLLRKDATQAWPETA